MTRAPVLSKDVKDAKDVETSRVSRVRRRGIVLFALFTSLAFFTSLQGAERRAQQSFRAGTRTVGVYATVRDSTGRLVTDLRAEEFQILDNDAPAAITTFSNEIQPFTAAVMFDMSNSMAPQHALVVISAGRFVNALLPADRIRIGSFGREVAVSPLLTGDKAVLSRIVDEELWPGGATPLWRATTAGMESLAGESGRRVILALTDGADSALDHNCAPKIRDPHGDVGSCPDRRDVRKQAIEDEFMFYGIGLEGTGLDQGIMDIADDTGGGYVILARNADLDAAFSRITDELHHQYVIGFTPAKLDGKTHRISVRVTRPGLTARARKSYVAEAAK